DPIGTGPSNVKGFCLKKPSIDIPATKLLGAAYTKEGIQAFAEAAWTVIGMEVRLYTAKKKAEWMAKFFDKFVGWCGQLPEIVPPFLQKALKLRKKAKDLHYRLRHDIAIQTYIHPRASLINPITPCEPLYAPRLDEPYPPHGYWVCKSKTILNLWDEHMQTRKLADSRGECRYPCMLLDEKKLFKTIRHDESCLICDITGKNLEGVVLRDFCNSQEILHWADTMIKKTTGFRNSIRKDNPGNLSLMGYTPRARNQPFLDWACNLKGPAWPYDTLLEEDHRASSVFAFAWNVCRQRAPQSIIKEYDAFFSQYNAP
ncbi:hypothetical protein AX16_001601, partial [Volvariella volvacea WC 439]